MLPTGKVLIWGGIDATGRVVDEGLWFDPANDSTATVDKIGLLPRAGHNATVLTDGRVLVTGGWSPSLGLLPEVELWDPRTARAELVTGEVRPPRLGATASLQADGRVVVLGGVDTEGHTVANTIAFDAATSQFADVTSPPKANPVTPPTLVASLPAAGAVDVAPSSWIALRFSSLVEVTSLTADTVTLFGPKGAVAATITPAGDGRLAFIVPQQELYPATRYTVFINGARDAHNKQMPFTTFDFSTASLVLNAPADPRVSMQDSNVAGSDNSPETQAPSRTTYDGTSAASSPAAQSQISQMPSNAVSSSASVDVLATADDERWLPSDNNRHGKWRTGRVLAQTVALRRNAAMSAFRNVASEQAEHAKSAGTSVSGVVLRQNDKPLAHVKISIGNISTVTDASGEFALSGATPGQHELIVDARNAGNGPTTQYGYFIIGVNVKTGEATKIAPIFLPKIIKSDWIDLPSPLPADTVVSTPLVPGMEIHIPKGAVLRDREGKLVSRIAIVPMPLDRSPFPFPENAPAYVSVQPGGMVVQGLAPGVTPGIRVHYPNQTDLKASERVFFWSYNTDDRGWQIYGEGQVSADAKQVVPDPGVALYESIGFMYTLTNPPPPTTAPPADGSGDGNGNGDGDGDGDGGGNNGGSGSGGGCNSVTAGDPVDCKSGLFVLDRTEAHVRGVIPINLTRIYRPGDTVSRAFGYGNNHAYAMYLREVSNTPGGRYQQFDLILADGSYVRFYRTSQGIDYQSVVAVHTNSASSFYGAVFDYENGYYVVTKTNGTKYIFSLYGTLQTIQDRLGNQLGIEHNGGQITRITSSSGRYIDFTYDAASRVTQMTDTASRTWGYEYSGSGNLIKATYPDGLFEQYTYDTNGQMLTLVDRRGITVVTNEYDASGRISKQTLADGSIYLFSYVFDGYGNVTQTNVTDPRNNVRVVTYDSHGYKASITDAAGTTIAQTTTFERDGTSGLLTAIVDARGRRTEFQRDYSTGSITQSKMLAGTGNAVIGSHSYTPKFNRVASYTNPVGKTTTRSYDAFGNLAAVTDPLQHQATYTHNTAGQVLARANGIGATTSYTYAAAGDVSAVQAPLNRTITFVRDPLGRRTGASDSLGRQIGDTYDVLGRTISTADPSGNATFNYDANGSLLSITDLNGGKTQFVYDTRNRLITRTDALNQSESWTYDGLGNVLTYTDRKGQQTHCQYDALNRPSLVTYADNSTVTFTFDSGNRLTQIVDSVSGTIARSYDDLDRLTQEQTPQGIVSYAYDAANRRTQMTAASQLSVTYGYDDANRLISITQGMETVGISYDNANRRSAVTLPNGVTMTYAYNAANQLTGLSYQTSNHVQLASMGYTYDAGDRRTSKAGGFGVDPLPTFSTGTNSFDLNNRQTLANGVAISYDVNGDPQTNSAATPSAQTYTFDVRHHLASIQQGGSTVASFAYDTLGRRTSKTVNGTTTTYLYDGKNSVQEAQGSTVTTLLTGLGIDERFARDETAGRRYFLTDALGSTVALADANGVVQQTYAYEPYGEVSTTGSSSNPYQYTGRENDGTGLYYYRARYYSPNLKRFISEDPIGSAGGLNGYAYVFDAPTIDTDPSGNCPACIPAAIIIIGGYEFYEHFIKTPIEADEAGKKIQEGAEHFKKRNDLDDQLIACIENPSCTNGNDLEDQSQDEMQEGLIDLRKAADAAEKMSVDHMMDGDLGIAKEGLEKICPRR